MKEDAKARAAREELNKQLTTKPKEEAYSGKGKGKDVAVYSETDTSSSESDSSMSSGGNYSDTDSLNNRIPNNTEAKRFHVATRTAFYLGQGNIEQYSVEQLLRFLEISQDARERYRIANVPASALETAKLLENEKVFMRRIDTLLEARSNSNPTSNPNPNPTSNLGLGTQ